MFEFGENGAFFIFWKRTWAAREYNAALQWGCLRQCRPTCPVIPSVCGKFASSCICMPHSRWIPAVTTSGYSKPWQASSLEQSLNSRHALANEHTCDEQSGCSWWPRWARRVSFTVWTNPSLGLMEKGSNKSLSTLLNSALRAILVVLLSTGILLREPPTIRLIPELRSSMPWNDADGQIVDEQVLEYDGASATNHAKRVVQNSQREGWFFFSPTLP